VGRIRRSGADSWISWARRPRNVGIHDVCVRSCALHVCTRLQNLRTALEHFRFSKNVSPSHVFREGHYTTRHMARRRLLTVSEPELVVNLYSSQRGFLIILGP
jgi:hypothetical protein